MKKLAIVLIIIGALILGWVIVHLILDYVSHISDSLAPGLPMLPTLAMLGDPFRTTRKMKVPPHLRKGHGERNSETFFTLVIILTIGVPLVLWLVQQLMR